MATPTVDPPRLARKSEPALAAYEEIASVYDVFTRAHDYERFLTVIEELALAHGLTGRDVLDVACGTGKSFMPLLRRGYHVTACDLSPAMVRIARDKCAGLADVVVADMRALPDLGRVDLVTCLDDSLNYLLTDDELGAALHGIQRTLRPDGLVVFDLNSLHTYRTAFTQTFAADQDGIFFCWRGETSPAVSEGEQAVATLEAFVKTASGNWTRRCSRHVQRHHPRAIVSRLCADAGLEVLEVFGQRPGARLDAVPREDEHTKLLYLARRSSFGAR